jgi:hypothetical protein
LAMSSDIELRPLIQRHRLGTQDLPMILLGIAALQFFIGILEPFFVDIGINPEPIRFIRHAHLAPLGLAFLVLIGMQGAMTSVARPVAGWLVWVVVAMISIL